MKRVLPYLIALFATLNFASCDDEEAAKVIPVVTIGAPTNVTTTTATILATITDNGNDVISKSGIVFSSNVALPTIADNKVESTITEGVFTAELTGLSSGTTYHVRAFATNSIGTSYSDVIDLSTGNAAPIAKDLSITGTLEVSKTVTAHYTYSDAENNPEAATTFQWYVATNSTGAGEAPIVGATSKTYVILNEDNGKFLRVGVAPKAASGTTNGVEVKSPYTIAVGAETVTFTYNGVSVIYGTIISAATQKTWLDRNLGASRPAQAVNDYQAYGDLFQWGRLADGHQLITRTGAADADAIGVNGVVTGNQTSSEDVPSTNQFIKVTTLAGDWRKPQNGDLWRSPSNYKNNPCPMGWRIPTKEEWAAEGITSLPDAYAKLGIPHTGARFGDSPEIMSSSEGAYYWSSSITTDGYEYSYLIQFSAPFSDPYAEVYTSRANGFACRCIKE